MKVVDDLQRWMLVGLSLLGAAGAVWSYVQLGRVVLVAIVAP